MRHRVIRAITCQGSVTTNHICPSRLRRDGQGSDPDLPALDQPRPSLCVSARVYLLLVIIGYGGLRCLDTLPVIIAF